MSFGVGLVVQRLREALKVLTEAELRKAFKDVDADGSGELGKAELKAALRKLGFNVNPSELDDLMDFFDTDGSGDVSIDEFLAFAAAEVGDGDDGPQSPVSAAVTKVRATLMGFGDDALRKVFEGPGGKLKELTGPQLGEALRKLGVPNLSEPDVASILRRMDDNNDGVVSYEELSGFLKQKAFAEGVRRVMARSAAVLRAQGTTLQAVLEKAARRDAAKTAAARGMSVSTGIPVVTTSTLERVLVKQLGFPLTQAQIAAVIAMADMDGSGDCDLEEVLYLADEEYSAGDEDGGADGSGAGTGGDKENRADGGDSDSDDGVVGLSSGSAKDKDTAALQQLQASCNVRIFAPGLDIGPGGTTGTGARAGAGDGLLDDFTCSDDYFLATEAGPSQLYGPLGIALETAEDTAAGGGSMEGRSGLEGLPLAAFQPGAPTPSEMWRNVVDSVHGLLATATPVVPGQAGSGQPLLEPVRAGQALAALGVHLPAKAVTALIRRVQAIGQTTGTVAASTAANGPPTALDSHRFRLLIDHAAMLACETGRGGLTGLAEARLRHSLRTFASANGGSAPSGGMACGLGVDDGLLTRHALAVALTHVPGAGLTPCEAIAVAAHAPGMYQTRALALVHAHMTVNVEQSLFDGVEVSERAGTAARHAFAAHAAAAAERQRPKTDPDSSFVLHGAAKLAALGHGLYPADISILRLACGSPVEGGDADVSIARLLTWIRVLAAGGASLLLCYPPAPNEQGVEQFCLPASMAFAALDPVARAGVTKLVAGTVGLPAPLFHASLPTPGSSLEQAIGGPKLQGQGSTPGQRFTSAFLLAAPRLPAHARPSLLGPLSYSHPWLTLGARRLLDCGWEADPANMYDTGRAATTALGPGTPASLAVPAGPNGSAPHPLAITSFTTAAGQAADGFGLTLRMASILPGSEEPPAGCLPVAAIPDKSTLLRPIGAYAGQGDAGWASEGAAVRSAAMLYTAVVGLAGAVAVPIPKDETLRSSIVGRVVRVAIVDMTPPTAADDTSVPRYRVLSNAMAVPATWNPSSEDVWSFPEAAVSHPTRLVLRTDQPRDGAGPAAALVLFECNVLIAHPHAAAGAQAAQQAAAAAANAPPAGSGLDDGEPYSPSRLLSHVVADPYPVEEVTMAWGTVPLSSLASDKADSTVKVSMAGGAPGAACDINPADILQRRGGFSALSLAVSGPSTVPTLSLAVTRLSKLKKSERQTLARLPMMVVVPYAWAPALAAFRRLYAERVLSMSRAHTAGPRAPAVFPAGAVFESVASLVGPAGNGTAIAALTRTVDAEVAARKRTAPNTSYATVLNDTIMKAWAVACAAGDGGAGSATGVGVGGPPADVVDRALAPGTGTALMQLMGQGGPVLAMRPVNTLEQLA